MQANIALKQSLISSFYLSHHDWLKSWLSKKLGCVHDAADLTQDTFIKAAFHADIDNIREPRAFLTTTATHLLVDLVRKRKIEQVYLEAMYAKGAENIPSPQQIKEAVETLSEIAAMLEGLPKKVYQAFLMYRLDGMSQAEIAAALGVSVSMVKQYIARAMLHCYQIAYPDQL